MKYVCQTACLEPPPSPPPPPPPPSPPPSPPSPPSPPPLPPGYLQMAGGYYMIESGSCGGALISTKSDCEAAATALDLSDKSATDFSSSTYLGYPPGCVSFYSTDLYVFNVRSTGRCSSARNCICMFTPPPSPPSPPSPPPPCTVEMLKQRSAGDKSWPVACSQTTLGEVDKELDLSWAHLSYGDFKDATFKGSAIRLN